MKTSKIIAIALALVLLLGTIIGLLWNSTYYPQPHLAALALAALRASRWNRASARVVSGRISSDSKSWAAIRAAIDASALAYKRLEEDPNNLRRVVELKRADKALQEALRLHR